MICLNCHQKKTNFIECKICGKSACEECWTEQSSSQSKPLLITIIYFLLPVLKSLRCPNCAHSGTQVQTSSYQRGRVLNQ